MIHESMRAPMWRRTRQWAGGLTGGVAFLSVPFLAQAQGWMAGRANAQMSFLPGGSIYGIIYVAMQWLLGILGFIAIIGFVIAGILYLTAAGNESQIERAKTAMTYSIIGVIVALMGYVIVQAVDNWLNTSPFF